MVAGNTTSLYLIPINLSDKSRYANIKLLPKAYKNDDWLNEKVLGNSPGKQRVHRSQNPYRPEELKHITSFNLRVRSKGSLDDRNYMLRDLKKTQLYFRNGIFEPHNLIVTTAT